MVCTWMLLLMIVGLLGGLAARAAVVHAAAYAHGGLPHPRVERAVPNEVRNASSRSSLRQLAPVRNPRSPGRSNRKSVRFIQDSIQEIGRSHPVSCGIGRTVGVVKCLLDGMFRYSPDTPASTHNPWVVGSIPTRPTSVDLA